LTDSETGRELSGDTFERPIADLFDLQVEIVAQLANALRAKLVADIVGARSASRMRIRPICSFQGITRFNEGYARENLAKAREDLQRALDVDPDNLTALQWMAGVDLTIAVNYPLGADRAAKFASVETAATKVLSLRPDDAQAHIFSGLRRSSPTAAQRASPSWSARWP
jgi:hypothetical protein